MNQKEMILNPTKGEADNNTHPSMLIRCRSLLWFSMNVHSLDDLDLKNNQVINKVNASVVKDLEALVDGQVRSRKIQLEREIAVWKAVLLIYHAGSFNKEVQARLEDSLSSERLESVKSFFHLYSNNELLEEITQRLDNVVSLTFKEFPASAKEIENIGFSIAYKIVES